MTRAETIHEQAAAVVRTWGNLLNLIQVLDRLACPHTRVETIRSMRLVSLHRTTGDDSALPPELRPS